MSEVDTRKRPNPGYGRAQISKTKGASSDPSYVSAAVLHFMDIDSEALAGFAPGWCDDHPAHGPASATRDGMGLQENACNPVFSPDQVALINRVYSSALGRLARLQIQKNGIAAQEMRVQLARIIMDLVRDGESSEHRLRESSLARLSTGRRLSQAA